MLTTIASLTFALGWIPVLLLRSERFSARHAASTADQRRAMWNAVAAVTVHVTLVEVALYHATAAEPPIVRLATGIAVFVIGLAFWALARHTLVAYGRLLDPTAPPPELVTSGPFTVVRHPLALGMVIVALGPAVAAATFLTWVSFATVVLTLARRCRQDEDEMHAAFGAAYERYADVTTARLLPLLW